LNPATWEVDVFLAAHLRLEEMDMDIVEVRKPIEVGKSMPDIIKVRGTSRTSAVAGAIAGIVREYNFAEVQAIGASAVNQAAKAMALAKGYLDQDGIHVVFTPEFVDVEIEGKVRTAIKFTVERR
jgi:stage V sporulation protein S